MEPKFRNGQKARIVRGRGDFLELEKYVGETARIVRYNTPIKVTYKGKPDEIVRHLYSVRMNKDKSIQIAPEDWLEPLEQ